MALPEVTKATDQKCIILGLVDTFTHYGQKQGVRLPTLLWIVSDLFGVVDFAARQIVNEMIEGGWLTLEHGWLK